MKFDLDLSQFSNDSFSETEKCFGVGPEVGVGDGHRLHNVLQFFKTLLKNCIVKN